MNSPLVTTTTLPTSSSLSANSSGSSSRFKIVVLGDESVGKSSILTRFVDDAYDAKNCRPTIGSDLISKTLHILAPSSSSSSSFTQTTRTTTMRLQIWDTAGQERFRSRIPSHIQGSKVAIIVYDVTHRPSFTNVPNWIRQVRENTSNSNTSILILLVGNKADDARQRDVTFMEGHAMAQQYQAYACLEVSARAGYNVRHLFTTTLGAALYQQQHRRRVVSSGTKQQQQQQERKQKQPQSINKNNSSSLLSPSEGSTAGGDYSTSSWSAAGILEAVQKSLLITNGNGNDDDDDQETTSTSSHSGGGGKTTEQQQQQQQGEQAAAVTEENFVGTRHAF